MRCVSSKGPKCHSDILSYTSRKSLCVKPYNIAKLESAGGLFRSSAAVGKLSVPTWCLLLILLFDYLGFTFLALRPFKTYTPQLWIS